MKRSSWIPLALATGCILAFGATPVYELADRRTNSDARPRKLHKLIVIAISDDREVRNRFEDKFVTHLKGKGFDALISHDLVPDLTKPADRQSILDALGREKVDGALTVRAVPLDGLGEAAWSAAWASRADAPSTVRDLVRSTVPVARKKAKMYGVELALWDDEASRPLWAARTGPVSIRDLKAGVGDLLRLTMESLKDTPWLGP
jgi:hypothetical protein